MIAELLATGDEIRTGALVDTNTAHIAEHLMTIGVQVRRHHCCGDGQNDLVAVLRRDRRPQRDLRGHRRAGAHQR